MILSGILHYSLGGFTVIRGVAPLGELARCSAILEGKRVIAPSRDIPIAVTPPQVPPSRRAAGGTPRRDGARGAAIRPGAF
jgi:hypothetical protein